MSIIPVVSTSTALCKPESEPRGCQVCRTSVKFANSEPEGFSCWWIPVENSPHQAPVAELADAHDSGSCARNGRGGSTPLRGKKHGQKTVLFYWPDGILHVGDNLYGNLFFWSCHCFVCLCCHQFQLHIAELTEAVVINLSVTVVLNFDGMPDPGSHHISRHS